MSEISLIPQTLTMTSREIAELVEKRHDNVKRTIETLVEKAVIPHPQIEGGPKAANGVAEKVYNLDKRSSIIVVAHLSPEFTARMYDCWQELERQVRDLHEQLTMSPQVLRDLIEGAAEKAVESYRQLDHINFNMLDAIGEVPDFAQHPSWEAVEELAQSYLKPMLDVCKSWERSRCQSLHPSNSKPLL